MNIREMTEEDVVFIVSVKEDFPDAYNTEMIKSGIKAGRLTGLIAETDGEKVGFLLFSKSIDDCDLESLYVVPEYRHRGIAKLLMKNFIVKADCRILLEVRENNNPAKNLYEKLGFKAISVRKNYYFDGENAVVMERRAEL